MDQFEAVVSKFDQQLSDSNKKFENFVKDSKNTVKEVEKELEGLLPGGMAAGLSAAYEDKKVAEEASKAKLERTFFWSIVVLVVIFLIPFGVVKRYYEVLIRGNILPI